MPSRIKDLPFGPVVVTKGKHKGRIGDYDDETVERGKAVGVVRFASFGISPYRCLIPQANLALPNTSQLFRRHRELFDALTSFHRRPLVGDERIAALEEINYVEGVLGDRLFAARLTHATRGAKIFLSHASADKTFVRGLAVDLKHFGHSVWLDEWEILAGESIPKKIAEGLEQSDFVAVILSKKSVASRWVETEWHAKYWDEINEAKIIVVPLLIETCSIPTLLKTKKYVDFREDYTEALERFGHTIARHVQRAKRAG